MSETSEKSNKCANGLMRKSYKWKQSGGKEGAFFVSTSPRCSKCEEGDLDECLKTSFKEAYPSQDYNSVNVYVNLKPKADVISQEPKPQQENAQEIKKEEPPVITEA